MITREEAEAATKVLNQYVREQNKLFITDYVCACCKVKKIVPLYNESASHPLRQEEWMWDDGTVARIDFGYGSRHDCEAYYIAICDDCIELLFDKKMAVNYAILRKKISDFSAD